MTTEIDALVMRLRLSAKPPTHPAEAAVMTKAADKLEEMAWALDEVGSWDCQGDSLRTAYDSVFGEGKWAALFGA